MKKDDNDLDYRQISVRIPLVLFDTLENATGQFRNKSDIVRMALEDYFEKKQKLVEIVAEVRPLQNLENPKEGLDLPISAPIFGGERPVDRTAGIDYKAVGEAMRNRRRGLPYNKSLERYFNV